MDGRLHVGAMAIAHHAVVRNAAPSQPIRVGKPPKMPFDMKRMSVGGFKVLVGG
jgi:uncharacterized protein YbaA (DUF1428 family)